MAGETLVGSAYEPLKMVRIDPKELNKTKIGGGQSASPKAQTEAAAMCFVRNRPQVGIYGGVFAIHPPSSEGELL